MIASKDTIKALVSELIRSDLIIFPVRHHSPACSWYLREVFSRFSPSIVLVEGPRSFSSQLPLLAASEAKMPLAIYTYAVQKGSGENPEIRRAAYYPFCDYSPELVAIREAHKYQIPTRFIDLDFAEQCLIESEEEGDEPHSLLDEKHYQRSSYLRTLAQKFGCRDHEELWEHLFEGSIYAGELENHIAQIAAYCHFARIDCSKDELTEDGTLLRESEMAWHIQQSIAERKSNTGPVLAVVGGFHAVALPSLLSSSVKRPSIPRLQISEEASALIRYSFDRLDRLNGYTAGMTSPAWHQILWEKMDKSAKAKLQLSSKICQEAALGVLFDIAFELREQYGIQISMPALSSAYEHALRLASLRKRNAPLREDVMDAVVSCFVKGDIDADGALVLDVAKRIFSGKTIGIVPAGACTPPLVKDFLNRAHRQRLKIDDADPRHTTLEIYRRPEHRVTSRLLHSLVFLCVPFAFRRTGPDFINGTGLERMQESWEYSFSAATEGGLVEAAVHGATIPLATANRFNSQLNRLETEGGNRDAKTASGILIHACVLGLHDHFARLTTLLRGAIGNDSAFDSVTSAACNIGLLLEAREPLEAQDVPELPGLLNAAYERAIYLGLNLPGTSSDKSENYCFALAMLRELLIGNQGQSLDNELYWSMVRMLFCKHPSAMLRGAAAGLLYNSSKIGESELSHSLAGHLNGLADPRESVAFLRGLMKTAREVAWQKTALLKILDALIEKWDENAFVSMLPELRLAFAEMTPKETDRIAEAVAHLHGKEDLGRLVRYDLSEKEIQFNLAVSATLKEVLDSDGLKAWLTT